MVIKMSLQSLDVLLIYLLLHLLFHLLLPMQLLSMSLLHLPLLCLLLQLLPNLWRIQPQETILLKVEIKLVSWQVWGCSWMFPKTRCLFFLLKSKSCYSCLVKSECRVFALYTAGCPELLLSIVCSTSLTSEQFCHIIPVFKNLTWSQQNLLLGILLIWLKVGNFLSCYGFCSCRYCLSLQRVACCVREQSNTSQAISLF